MCSGAGLGLGPDHLGLVQSLDALRAGLGSLLTGVDVRCVDIDGPPDIQNQTNSAQIGSEADFAMNQ